MENSELKKQREYRKRTGNRSTKKYERTIKGFLMRTYRNMESRVTGIQKNKAHLYKGLELLTRDSFYFWSQGDKDFLRLFTEWESKGFPRMEGPSIDRIDSSKGYTLDNIQWITTRENSLKGLKSRWK